MPRWKYAKLMTSSLRSTYLKSDTLLGDGAFSTLLHSDVSLPLASRSSIWSHASFETDLRLSGEPAIRTALYSTPAAPLRGSLNVAAVKQLRERSGAPMKDVKKALEQCNWDIEAAFTELRKKGLAAASKKAARVAAEGLLGFAARGNQSEAVLVEVNSETDFVARNDIFQHLVHKIAHAALDIPSSAGSQSSSPSSSNDASEIPLSAIEEAQIEMQHPRLSGERRVGEAVAEVAAITGEKIALRRAFRMVEAQGVVGAYLHMGPQPDLGRIGGLIALAAEEEGAASSGAGAAVACEARELAEQVAMHVVAMRPLYLQRNAVPAEALAHERTILATQAASSGKPSAVIEKMVEGRLKKFYEDVVLLDQRYMLDETKTVQAVVKSAGQRFGRRLTVTGMLRIAVGEGIQKEEKDFASEVESAVAQAAAAMAAG
eukprot:TRINITY_DN24585_c0_g1_i1.p1 TRINITY_DN24585_c0_g1~~TRINITY_DN24585_c0_g1_i1.p1  ORF type:complete len:432 (-),score=102.37 TRINITY_DN24585_c0_g1_i1:257-1552(-)